MRHARVGDVAPPPGLAHPPVPKDRRPARRRGFFDRPIIRAHRHRPPRARRSIVAVPAGVLRLASPPAHARPIHYAEGLGTQTPLIPHHLSTALPAGGATSDDAWARLDCM